MKFNLAYPPNGTQKQIEVDDEKKLTAFYDRRLANVVDGAALGEDFQGYQFKINGGADKQGFPMHQGVGTALRVRLLLKKGESGYARGKRGGVRRRKSVRGCIVSPEISVLNLTVIKRGEKEIEGLTDRTIDRRLAPKRVTAYRKMFNLGKKDDVRDYVIRRELPQKEGKGAPGSKAPKLQRLITPTVLQRKRQRLASKKAKLAKAKAEEKAFQQVMAKRRSERREALQSKRVAARSASVKKPAKK